MEEPLVTCASCGAANPAGTEFCEICGTPVAARGKARTAMAPPPDAARKSRTLYDPGPARPEPSPGDVFTEPARRRSGFDPADPFKSSIVSDARPAPAPRAPQAARAEAPARRRQATVLSPGAPVQQPLRGVLCVHGPGEVRLVPLYGGRTAVGRDDDADVVIDDANVSGSHGFMYLKEHDASFIDVSRNGSVVDGVPLMGETCPLSHGSVLELGGTRCILLLVPSEAVSPS